MSVKEVVEVMEKKTAKNWTADPVIQFMLTLEQKTFKKKKRFFGLCSAFLDIQRQLPKDVF